LALWDPEIATLIARRAIFFHRPISAWEHLAMAMAMGKSMLNQLDFHAR
jgi:hypothetical protein